MTDWDRRQLVLAKGKLRLAVRQTDMDDNSYERPCRVHGDPDGDCGENCG